jgi:hypothetical protein
VSKMVAGGRIAAAFVAVSSLGIMQTAGGFAV